MHDFVFELRLKFFAPVFSRTDRSHSARIRSGVTVKGTFVIARRRQYLVICSVDKRVQRTFPAAQKFLNHDSPARFAELFSFHHLADRSRCFRRVWSDDDAFAESKTVGLDDDRELEIRSVALRVFT